MWNTYIVFYKKQLDNMAGSKNVCYDGLVGIPLKSRFIVKKGKTPKERKARFEYNREEMFSS